MAQETDVQVVFSTTMDAETIVDTANFMVLGSVGGVYNVEAAYDDPTRTLTLTLLAGTGSLTAPMFALGETVTVTLTNRVTSSIGIPLNRKTFSFVISGVASGDPDAVADNQFLVTSTDPAPNAVGVSAIPPVRVSFGTRVDSSVAGGSATTWLAGGETGNRPVNLQLTGVDTEGTSAEGVVINMQQNRPFAVGERVTFSLTDRITGTVLNDSGDSIPATLRPYVGSFRVQSGIVDPGSFNPPQTRNFTGESNVFEILVREIAPNPGAELIAISPDRIAVLVASGSTYVTDVAATVPGIVAVTTADWDGNGAAEILTLSQSGGVQIIDSLRYSVESLTFDPPEGSTAAQPFLTLAIPGVATDIVSADFMGNGGTSLLVSTTQGLALLVRIPAQVVSLGTSTITVGESSFAPMPLPTLAGAEALDWADFDGDGRLDVVSSRTGGITLLRNVGNGSFVEQRELVLSSFADAEQFFLADTNLDGLLDVVALDGGNVVSFVNDGSWPATQSTGLLAGPFAHIVVADLTGDRLPDVATVSPSGEWEIFASDAGQAGLNSFELGTTALPPAARLMTADQNRDTGLDIVLLAPNSVAIASTSGVTEEPNKPRFQMTPTLVVDVSAQTHKIPVMVRNISGSVTELQFTMNYPGASFEFVEATSPLNGLDITATEAEDPPRVSISATLDTPLALADGGTVFQLEFQPLVIDVGNFSFSGASGSALLVNGATLFPDLGDATTTLVVESSVPAVENVACSAGDDAVTITWTNTVGYTFVRVLRDGQLMQNVFNGGNSAVDNNPPPGEVTYSVAGFLGAQSSVPRSCQVEVFPPVTDVTCERRIPGNHNSAVDIAWTAAVAYPSYQVLRDGNLLNEVVITSFQDNSANDGDHTYTILGVQGESLSSSASCFLAGDPASENVTAIPTNAELSVQNFNSTRFSWTNTESYDSLEIERLIDGVFDQLFTTQGFVTVFTDNDLLPGLYSYTVRAVANDIASGAITSPQVLVQLPPVTGLDCSSTGNGALLTWTNGADFYTDIEITRDGSVIATLLGTATSYSDLGLVDGEYVYTVRALRQGVVQSGDSIATAPCTVSIINRMSVSDVTWAPGVRNTFVDVTLDSLETLSAVSFDLLFDGSVMTLTAPANDPAAAVFVPFVGAEVTVESGAADPQDPSNTDRRLTVTVSGLNLPPGDDELFCRIFAEARPTFDGTLGTHTLLLESAEFVPQVSPEAPFAPELVSGQLTVSGNAIQLGDSVIEVESGAQLLVPVFGTFSQPISSVQVVVNFDSRVLAPRPTNFVASLGEFALFSKDVGTAQEGASAFAVIFALPHAAEIRAPLGTLIFDVLDPAQLNGAVLTFGEILSAATEPLVTEYLVTGSSGIVAAEAALFDAEVVFLPSPTLTQLFPNRGPLVGGGTVELQGVNLSDVTAVTFGGVAADVVAATSSTVSVIVPPTASTTDLTVDVQLSRGELTTSLFQAYTYNSLQLSNLSPNVGNFGVSTPVTLQGQGFTSTPTITFGGVPATVNSVSETGTTMLVNSPAAALGELDVTVSLADGQSATLPAAFSVFGDPPVLNAVNPAVGCPGTSLLLSGMHFGAQGLQVTIGGVEAEVTLVNTSSIQCTVPEGSGTVDVTVTTSFGSGTLNAAFTYGAFEVTSFEPASLSPCSSELLISGSGFEPGLTVSVGGNVLEDVIVSDGCSIITATLPPSLAASGSFDLVVTNPGGASIVLENALTIETEFIRGDMNGNGVVDQADLDALIAYLTNTSLAPANLDTADVNDDGSIGVGDVVYLANFVNNGTAPPPAPFPAAGVDPTADGLCL